MDYHDCDLGPCCVEVSIDDLKGHRTLSRCVCKFGVFLRTQNTAVEWKEYDPGGVLDIWPPPCSLDPFRHFPGAFADDAPLGPRRRQPYLPLLRMTRTAWDDLFGPTQGAGRA
jgi:hypothetical protein